MKKILYAFLFIMVVGGILNLFDDGKDTNQASKTNTKTVSKEKKKLLPHPSQSVLDAIQKSLDSWGEERWANWKVGYNENERNIYIQVAADPIANEIAMKGYIGLIKDLHKKHASKYNMVGRVYQLGKQKETCFVYGQ